MKAILYRQETPDQVVTKERDREGNWKEFYQPKLARVSELEGSYDEIWNQAKKLCKCPVMEWK